MDESIFDLSRLVKISGKANKNKKERKKRISNTPVNDISGKVFHELFVLRLAPKEEWDKNGGSAWICKCSCGIECVRSANDMRRGKVKTCGLFHYRIKNA